MYQIKLIQKVMLDLMILMLKNVIYFKEVISSLPAIL